jgi:Na+-translocating ferredoxin:NAD+ oxidoreductase subunit B
VNATVESTPLAAGSLVQRIDALLPQMQCRRCGHAACRPYAEAVAGGGPVDGCPPGGAALVAALATLTGRAAPREAARLPGEPLQVATIDEAACIGCVLCLKACPVDAIVGAPKRMHAIVAAWCTGCGLCVPPCPVDCIGLAPAGREWSAADARASRSRYLAHAARHRGAQVASPAPGVAAHSSEAKAAAVARALARARARRHAAGASEEP